jgi:hypothetical protein
MPTAGRFTFFPVGFTRSFEPPLTESRHDIAVAKRPAIFRNRRGREDMPRMTGSGMENPMPKSSTRRTGGSDA